MARAYAFLGAFLLGYLIILCIVKLPRYTDEEAENVALKLSEIFLK